jgi:hypothetical protein
MPKDSPTPKPIPPPGYEIQNLPDFLKPANANTKIASAPPMKINGNIVDSDVDPAKPNTIEVRTPAAFTQPIQTHESTHIFQESRNPAFLQSGMKLQAKTQGTPAMYDYGGIEGLEKALQQGKTIAHFTPEQQARMVEDYQKATQDAIRRGDPAALARVTAAYHPLIGQLAKIPPKGANMTQMTQQDLTPAAPPVPPATVAGMPLLPDKLIGGATAPPKTVQQLKSQALRLNPVAGGHKIGEVKKFANGKTGVWDGNGWEAK